MNIRQTLPLAQNVSNQADNHLASAVIRQVVAAIRHTSITGAVITLYSLTHLLVHAVNLPALGDQLVGDVSGS